MNEIILYQNQKKIKQKISKELKTQRKLALVAMITGVASLGCSFMVIELLPVSLIGLIGGWKLFNLDYVVMN